MALTPEELEDLAFEGKPMPEVDSQADEMLYLCFRNLYAYARKVQMPKEQGSKEKAQILDKYRKAKFGETVLGECVEMWKRIDAAASAYRLNPSIEAADQLLKVIYRADRKRSPDVISMEEFLRPEEVK